MELQYRPQQLELFHIPYSIPHTLFSYLMGRSPCRIGSWTEGIGFWLTLTDAGIKQSSLGHSFIEGQVRIIIDELVGAIQSMSAEKARRYIEGASNSFLVLQPIKYSLYECIMFCL